MSPTSGEEEKLTLHSHPSDLPHGLWKKQHRNMATGQIGWSIYDHLRLICDCESEDDADYILSLQQDNERLREALGQAKWDAITYKAGDHPWVPLGIREDGFTWTILVRSGDYQRPGFDWSGEPFGRFGSQTDAQKVANALNEAEHTIRELRAQFAALTPTPEAKQ